MTAGQSAMRQWKGDILPYLRGVSTRTGGLRQEASRRKLVRKSLDELHGKRTVVSRCPVLERPLVR
jgi:hypothetical protein